MPNRSDREWMHRLGRLTPLDVAAAWPIGRSLIMLHSGRSHAQWARWSILASPSATYRFQTGSEWVEGLPAVAPLSDIRFSHDPLTDLDAIISATADQDRPQSPSAVVPFCGGWIGFFSYDLGRVIEPRAQRLPHNRSINEWPLIELAYCPNAIIHDNIERRWHIVGDPQFATLVNPKSKAQNPKSPTFSLSPLKPTIAPDHYTSMVGRTLDYIAAGDIFQANIAQQFTATLTGSARAFALAALHRAQPWYGAYLESPDSHQIQNRKSKIQNRALVSLSPELFLQCEPHTRVVTTRPIKGTRPASSDRAHLLHSQKDAAELHMIVDLMRNDLGRVCDFGSVRVVQSRQIETHPTVHQGVAEVTGTFRDDLTFADLLRATFPGGSVTGAPKIRAMQIIDELEPCSRGPYCGAIGYISNCGRACLNIAIRTAQITRVSAPDASLERSSLSYSAGAGIVADSNPISEYRECLDKTAIIGAIADQFVPLALEHHASKLPSPTGRGVRSEGI